MIARLLLLCLLLLSVVSATAQVVPARPTAPSLAGFVSDDPLWHCWGCENPVYKNGGFTGMQQAVAQNLRFPPGLQKSGRVFVRFTIDTTGRVRNAIVKQSLQPDADSVAVQAVRLLGRFTPARDPRGRPLAVKFTVPVTFSIE